MIGRECAFHAFRDEHEGPGAAEHTLPKLNPVRARNRGGAEDGVKPETLGEVNGLFTVGHRHHSMAPAAQQRRQAAPERLFLLDQQERERALRFSGDTAPRSHRRRGGRGGWEFHFEPALILTFPRETDVATMALDDAPAYGQAQAAGLAAGVVAERIPGRRAGTGSRISDFYQRLLPEHPGSHGQVLHLQIRHGLLGVHQQCQEDLFELGARGQYIQRIR